MKVMAKIRPRSACIVRGAAPPIDVLAACAFLLGPAMAQQDGPPVLRDRSPARGTLPLLPKPKLPPVSPFLSAPAPGSADDGRADLPIGDGV
ncbi:hypothetical protein WDZ92_51355, partial [Nostoc sp. NIES-2111]